MVPVHYKRAAVTDLPTVITLVDALLRELGEEGEEAGALDIDHFMPLLHEVGEKHVAVLAETVEGTPVGVLTLDEAFALYANGKYGVINEMYVVPEYRGLDVGGGLLREAESYGRMKGWRRIDVTAPEAERWLRTRRFYERHGFVFTGPKLKKFL